MIRDRNISWLRQSHVIPNQVFSFFTAAGPTTASIALGSGVGAPVWGEVVDGLGAPLVSTANDFICAWDFFTPRHADVTKEIGVRVWYTVVGAPTALDAVTWKILYDQVDQGEAIVTPATALGTAIVAQANGGTTEKKLFNTTRGIIAANTLNNDARKGVMAWTVESDAITTYTATQLSFLGLEIDYEPGLCKNERDVKDIWKDLAVTNGA